MKRRHAILLLGGASSGAMSVGTGAFNSVNAERGVEVNVAEDERAYLGITVDEEADAVRVRNQFATRLDLTVTLKSADSEVGAIEVEGPITFVDETDGEGGIDIDEDGGHGGLGPGNEARVRVGLDEAGEASFTLSFAGEAGDANVDKIREFTLRPRDVTGRVTKVKFPGDKLRILTGESSGNSGVDGVASAKLYTEDADGNVASSDGFEYVPVNTNIRVGDFDDGGLKGSIAGVEIKEIEGVFVRPDTPGNGTGNTVATGETESDPFDG